MQDVVILSAVRTPIGAFQGAFRDLAAHQLGARALAAAVEAAGVEPSDVDQVNMGCVLAAGQGQAPARQVALGAGLPASSGAVTVNKVCGSGMRAVMVATNDLKCGDYSVVAAGGMESMSRAPYLLPGARSGLRLGNAALLDSLVHDGLWDPYNDSHMGNCAELCAREYHFGREEQDAFAERSYERSRRATEEGWFADEIVPVVVEGKRGATTTVDRDEDPYRVDLERLRTLRPAFEPEGTVTAANASNLSDGAASLVLSSEEFARTRGLRPLARVIAHASVAQAPEWFTTAPVVAIKAVLERAELTVDQIDLFEINEAFAVVVLACLKDLELDPEKVNVHGGAISMGHPIGASGARIVTTLIHALRRRGGRFGCAAICIGGGEATALVLERLSEED